MSQWFIREGIHKIHWVLREKHSENAVWYNARKMKICR